MGREGGEGRRREEGRGGKKGGREGGREGGGKEGGREGGREEEGWREGRFFHHDLIAFQVNDTALIGLEHDQAIEVVKETPASVMIVVCRQIPGEVEKEGEREREREEEEEEERQESRFTG